MAAGGERDGVGLGRWAAIGMLWALLASCSTVDPGSALVLAPVTFDENFFYCQIEPNVLLAKSCGTGDASLGDSGGCHQRVTEFVLQDVPSPTACNGIMPTGAVSPASLQNYQKASEQMSLDIDNAPLLAWPTKKIASHPRQIFAADSPEADLIREWATKYASH